MVVGLPIDKLAHNPLHQGFIGVIIRVSEGKEHMSKRDRDLYVQSNNEEYLTRCVVDTCSRSFYLYSSEGAEQVVECNDIDDFMDILSVCKDFLQDELVYSDVLVTDKRNSYN
jgi:hypothetical protein